VASPDIVATVSPFRAARNPRVFKSSVNDNETERLKRELLIEQEHVQRLSAQLSTNVILLQFILFMYYFFWSTLNKIYCYYTLKVFF